MCEEEMEKKEKKNAKI